MLAIAMYLELLKCLLLALISLLLIGCDLFSSASNTRGQALKVVIIRHAEKAKDGDNLSCQGQNRALHLANVLYHKINKPDFTYVPALKLDKATKHSRMFQTVTPFAVKYDLTINSEYKVDDYADIAKSVLKKDGTVLIVWSHNEIPHLVNALGVNQVPKWDAADFDTICTIVYANGKAKLAIDQEGIKPSTECNF